MKTEIQYRRTFQGAWELSAMVQEGIYAYIEHAQFMGHTKKEATRLFRQYLKDKAGAK